MSTISRANETRTNPASLASQSTLIKRVLDSNVDKVGRALRTASAEDVANAIRESNKIVAVQVNGATSGVRPLQVDALLRAKMLELDSQHPVLNEVIADGARSAVEL